MNNIVTTYVQLFIKSAKYLTDIRWVVIFFMVTSVGVALTEGASILLLVPILNSEGNLSAYADSTMIGPVAQWLSNMEKTDRLLVVVAALASILLFRGLLTILLRYLSSRIPLEVLSKISQGTLDLILRADLAYIHRRDYASLRTYFYELPLNMSAAVNALVESFSKIILLLIYLSIMLTISWKMTLVAIVFVLLLGSIIKGMLAFRLRINSHAHADSQVHWGDAILMALMGSSLIRLSNAQSIIGKKYKDAISQFVKADLIRQFLIGLNGPLITTGAGIFICAIIAFASIINKNSEENWMVEIIIFVVTMYRMVPPASDIFSTTVVISAQLVSFDRLEAFASSVALETMPNGNRVFNGLQKEIRIDGVCFHYRAGTEGADTKEASERNSALNDVTLTIPKGGMVALVGTSGAGKSTLASLLCRLYDPQKGTVSIDGYDLRSFDVATWRNKISMVSQDIFLFNDTVLNNIRFGFEDISIERVREVVRMAAAESFVDELPDGLDTQLGEMGVRLSGGQKQRISIARAILKNPDVLILDEATSHLDSVTERAIQSTIDQLSRGRTVIAIAHRLSTVMHADLIVVMDQGCVVEQGTHEELVAKRGGYWDLLQHQVFVVDAVT